MRTVAQKNKNKKEFIRYHEKDAFSRTCSRSCARASLRKGTDSEDISGDSTDYAKTEAVTVGDITVTEKGDGENVFSAVWTKGDYSYAFFSTVGVSAEAFAELIAGIE